jgi:hypothetical protein
MKGKNCLELEANKVFHEVAVKCFAVAAQHSSENTEKKLQNTSDRTVGYINEIRCTFEIHATDTDT